MNVQCSSCKTVYRVDPAKVPGGGTRARCAVCAATLVVRGNGTPAAAPSAAPAPAPASAPAPAPAPAPPREAAAPRAPRRVTQPFFQQRASEAMPGPAAAEAPMAAPAPRPRPSAPVFRPTPGQPLTAPPPATPPPVPPRVAPRTSEVQEEKKYVNPFLARDPRQKARRLARALVSDMIVYQPEKRQQALKQGNLKEAFEDEIQKSWEEYVEQVGEELAASTPYWRDALNEILAGGQRIF